MTKPQLGGEQLNRHDLAAMLNSLGTKNEIISNSAIAAGFDQSSPSPSAKRKKVTFGKDTGNKNSGLNATNDSKRHKMFSLATLQWPLRGNLGHWWQPKHDSFRGRQTSQERHLPGLARPSGRPTC